MGPALSGRTFSRPTAAAELPPARSAGEISELSFSPEKMRALFRRQTFRFAVPDQTLPRASPDTSTEATYGGALPTPPFFFFFFFLEVAWGHALTHSLTRASE